MKTILLESGESIISIFMRECHTTHDRSWFIKEINFSLIEHEVDLKETISITDLRQNVEFVDLEMLVCLLSKKRKKEDYLISLHFCIPGVVYFKTPITWKTENRSIDCRVVFKCNPRLPNFDKKLFFWDTLQETIKKISKSQNKK